MHSSLLRHSWTCPLFSSHFAVRLKKKKRRNTHGLAGLLLAISILPVSENCTRAAISCAQDLLVERGRSRGCTAMPRAYGRHRVRVGTGDAVPLQHYDRTAHYVKRSTCAQSEQATRQANKPRFLLPHPFNPAPPRPCDDGRYLIPRSKAINGLVLTRPGLCRFSVLGFVKGCLDRP